MADRATKPKIDNSDQSVSVDVLSATTLESLIETLQELSQRLAPLASAMAPTAQLRATITGVVTGPITSAQSIAQKNTAGVMYTMRVATENNTSIQSNINNVTA